MRKSTHVIILLTVLLCMSISTSFAQQQSPVIRFGLIADIQYGDCESNGTRYYRNSLAKLEACVADLNAEKVDFTINLGDLVDRNPSDILPVTTILDKANHTVYNLTGNHDYGGITNNQLLYQLFSMPHEYYSFREGNWRFILLNTNEVASYANIQNTWKEKELAVMTDRIRESGRNNGQSWNGGIGSIQLQWLDEQLQASQSSGEKVLIFTHHPLYPESGYTALNDKEILDVLSKYTCIKAVFSGHHHTGAFGYYQHIPCVTTEGMIETESENAYGIVAIYDDRIILTGKGRTKSYTLDPEK